jgi:hypothetical protein
MKTITLEEAFDIIENANAIIINDVDLVFPSTSSLNGDDENEFMYLSWEACTEEYNLKFSEGDNREVKVIGSSLYLYDADADDETCYTKLTILINRNLE